MANPIKSDDINFQPPVKSYAYSSSNPVPKSQITINPVPENPSAKNNSRNVLNTILTLVFSILGFLFLFFIFLVVLNYFNIISLNNFSPAFNNLPKSQLTKEEFLKSILPKEEPIYFPDSNSWKVQGTFYRFNNEIIKVKTGNLSFMNFVFGKSSLLLISGNKIEKIKPSELQAATLFDLDQKKNLGKMVEIEYRTENKINYINKIILYYSP